MVKPNQAFVLCAGMGTRLLPLTENLPKCLLEIKGKPVLTRILDKLADYSFDNVVINSYYKYSKILEYVSKNRTRYKFQLRVVVENDILGTAGGINNACYLLRDEFLVYYGDVLTNTDLSKVLEGDGDFTVLTHQTTKPEDVGIFYL